MRHCSYLQIERAVTRHWGTCKISFRLSPVSASARYLPTFLTGSHRQEDALRALLSADPKFEGKRIPWIPRLDMLRTGYSRSAVSAADIRIDTRTAPTVLGVFVSGVLVVRHVGLLFVPVMRNVSRSKITMFKRVLNIAENQSVKKS